MTVASITEVLGGSHTLKRQVYLEADLTSLIRAGLPIEVLDLLARELSLDRKKLAKTIGISERTLNRRLSVAQRFSLEESDRIVRLARVIALAKDTLGSAEKARLWLQTPNAVLTGHVPLDLLDTDTGARSVETVLGRIAWGIYS